jgi:hypothetical protein
MNRKNLTAAVLAGLAGVAGIVGSAQAVNLNPDGIGQVLIYPYYTVNAGNQTVLSVVNTSESAKAVKVRFLEGQNSREVLDFNLYLSAYDVWVAAIYDAADVCIDVEGEECVSVPTLVTPDSSCTVPYFYGGDGTQEFVPWALTDEADYDPEDLTTLGSMNRASEGHFEMIEMGTVIDESESAIAMTHVAGVPADCPSLVLAWTQLSDLDPDTKGYWLQNPLIDMTAPSGGLFGAAAIVDVNVGTMYSYDAKAINGFATSIIAKDILHSEPGFTTPNLNSGDVGVAFAFLDNGQDVQWNFTRGVDAVSYVFMHDTLMNEYTTNDDLGAGTEWVITFPTKHFYVYPETSDSLLVLPPFTERWDGDEEKPNTACEVVILETIWDREEGEPGVDIPDGTPIPPIVSPAPPVVPGVVNPIIPFELCYETNVIAFGEDSDTILGSSNLHVINNDTALFTSDHGWARLELDDYNYDEGGTGIVDCEFENGEWFGPDCNSRDRLGNLEGLPIVGFAVEGFVNSFLGDDTDVLANYGGTFQHKGTVKLAVDIGSDG